MDENVSQLVGEIRQQMNISGSSNVDTSSENYYDYDEDEFYEPPVIPNQGVPYGNHFGLQVEQPIAWLT